MNWKINVRNILLAKHGKDVNEYVHTCDVCQKTKGSIQSKVVKYIPWPTSEPWEILHMDLVGPLPKTKDGYKYILTMMDRFSHFIEAVPLKTHDTREVVIAFHNFWTIRHGTPDIILSDKGAYLNDVKKKRGGVGQKI